MAMTIPTIPAMPAGYIAQTADLNNLAYAAQFLLNKPMARIHDTAGSQAITATPTAVTFGSASYDTDGMWASGAPTVLTVQTPGYYWVEYAVSAYTSGASTLTTNSVIVVTTGANNPAGSGLTSQSWAGGSSGGAPSNRGFPHAAGVIPQYLYAADTVSLQVWATGTGMSLNTGTSATYLSLDYASI